MKDSLIGMIYQSEDQQVSKLDERFDFSVTIDDLTRFMEREIPTKNQTNYVHDKKIFNLKKRNRDRKGKCQIVHC